MNDVFKANISYNKSKSKSSVHNETVEKILELEKQGKVFVIRPSEDINVKRLEKDIEKLNHVYNLGVKDGNHIIEDLKQYINNKGDV